MKNGSVNQISLSLSKRHILIVLLFLSAVTAFAQESTDVTLQGTITNVLSYLLLDESSDGEEPNPITDVTADLKSLTRVDGISPETIYFSAEDSTCSDCDDIFGLDTALADVYSELAYHFDFDDSDSGSFASTGNSRNNQVSGVPRAAHTFECSGSSDPNWDSSDQRCEFNVGVRVQAKDGDYDDAFLQVNIQPLYGPGGYYEDDDITCVSSTANYTECLALAPGADTATDIPAIGNWDGKLALVHNNGATYSNICMGADEQNATVATYGSGSRPVFPLITLASRPGTCSQAWVSDSNLSALIGHLPQRDSNGHLIDGFAFNQTVTGLRVGKVLNGLSYVLLNFHDIDMDFSADGTYAGEFTMAQGHACVFNDNLSCTPDSDSPGIPYPMFLFMSDMVIKGSSDNSNLPGPVNIGCFNGCGGVNFVMMGVEVDRAVEHNFRMMGSWGMLMANNWFRGNHVGIDGAGTGGKSRVTVRAIYASALNDLNKNPDDFDTPDYFREGGSDDFYNRYNNFVDNYVNQTVQDPNHGTAGWVSITGLYSVFDNTQFFTDQFEDGGDFLITGRYQVVRNATFSSPAFRNCTIGQGYYPDGTSYNDWDDIYMDDSPHNGWGCGTNGITADLAVPSAPGS